MVAIGTLLAQLHALLAGASAIVAGLLLVLGALDGTGLVRAGRWMERLAAVLLAALVLVTMLGPGIMAGIGGPAEPLHFLYAAIALAAVPLARYAATRLGTRQSGWWVAAGALVTLGALLGLWLTGP